MATEYEMALVLRPELDEEQQKAILDRYGQIIQRYGGSLDEPNIWGKRRLAYEVKDQSEGIYIFLPFAAESGANAELDRLLRIDDNVLRYLVVLRPKMNPPKPTSLPEAAAPRADGARIGPVPAGERHALGLPVRKTAPTESADAPTVAEPTEGDSAPTPASAEDESAEE